MFQLYVGSTTLIELTGLQDTTDNSYPQTATVTCDLVDATGAPVTGGTALSLPFVAGTTGATSKYRGVLPASVALVLGARYTATITATDASGNVRTFTVACAAVAG